MNRRSFFSSAVLSAMSGSLVSSTHAQSVNSKQIPSFRSDVLIEGPKIQLAIPGLKQTYKILYVSDTHLTIEDERDAEYKIYSARMAGAHQKKKHFLTNAPTSPLQSFEEMLAQADQYDLLVLGGDILNFPSIKGVEWLIEKLSKLKTPWRYTAGNHDWHFEGMEGSSEQLRATWIEKRLKPLYQGESPMCHSFKLAGEVEIALIDNSTYTIQPEQLNFLQSLLAQGLPTLIFQHIPFYAKGRSVGYGCGHPEWGASTDKHFNIERRPQWPAERHSETTFSYRQLAIDSQNLVATFSGHTHQFGFDLIQGLPQFVVKEHACGAHYVINLEPTA